MVAPTTPVQPKMPFSNHSRTVVLPPVGQRSCVHISGGFDDNYGDFTLDSVR